MKRSTSLEAPYFLLWRSWPLSADTLSQWEHWETLTQTAQSADSATGGNQTSMRVLRWVSLDYQFHTIQRSKHNIYQWKGYHVVYLIIFQSCCRQVNLFSKHRGKTCFLDIKTTPQESLWLAGSINPKAGYVVIGAAIDLIGQNMYLHQVRFTLCWWPAASSGLGTQPPECGCRREPFWLLARSIYAATLTLGADCRALGVSEQELCFEGAQRAYTHAYLSHTVGQQPAAAICGITAHTKPTGEIAFCWVEIFQERYEGTDTRIVLNHICETFQLGYQAPIFLLCFENTLYSKEAEQNSRIWIFPE